ncbi:MAG: helix-turn-helix domain-containing protein [Pseudomonadota bacterium]|nr:helix-turn-helix domain-containing protein [Pseudomonadota bacterium]
MTGSDQSPVEVLIVAVPETAGSALYGMVDVLLAAGSIWQTLVRTESVQALFRVRIVAPSGEAFTCGNRIPVVPDFSVADDPKASILILPELWLGPDEDIRGRYPELVEWIRQKYREGTTLYSACSGAVMLAETGLLDGCEATSHWGYQDLFRKLYPKVRFRPEPNLVFADVQGRIVTAGGTTSWHDLAIHIISRHSSPGEALRIAKVYLLKWHGEGQLPYATLVRRSPHADSVVRSCEEWLGEHFRATDAIKQVVKLANIPERTLKRRFKSATSISLIDYLQNLRIEEAKRLLESGQMPVDEISVEVSYKDPSFFRRLFKRRTGLTPSQYRRMFQPAFRASDPTHAARQGSARHEAGSLR